MLHVCYILIVAFVIQGTTKIFSDYKGKMKTSLVIHWLRLHAPNAGV